MPKGVTTNIQLQQLAKRMRIPYFRGIFIVLSYQGGMYRNESSIVWIMLMNQILIGWRTRSGEIMLFTLTVSAIED